MSERKWAIGDWCKHSSGFRYLVYRLDDEFVYGVGSTHGSIKFRHDSELVKYLIDCTGWDWQPPKPQPKVRPMTRAEFLAAWKQRGFCPLINEVNDIDVVLTVMEETEYDLDCVNLNNAGWCSMDELASFKFASDETYLTVEE
jgi:hypothetical protein